MILQHVYQPSYRTVAQPPGFADFVIGTMSLFYFNNKQLYVDYSGHPISSFLSNLFIAPSELFIKDSLVEMFNQSQQDIINLIKTSNTPIKMSTNSRGYVMSDELRHFIKNAFKPNKEFQTEIDSRVNELQLTNFDTIHIRLGDKNMRTSADCYKTILEKIIFEKFLDRNIFITSDNKDIKTFLSNKFSNVKIIQNNPIHLGDLLNTKSLLDDVKNTLLDFYIMSKTNNVFCYSIYGGSGFSYCCSEIFNFNYSAKHI